MLNQGLDAVLEEMLSGFESAYKTCNLDVKIVVSAELASFHDAYNSSLQYVLPLKFDFLEVRLCLFWLGKQVEVSAAMGEV